MKCIEDIIGNLSACINYDAKDKAQESILELLSVYTTEMECRLNEVSKLKSINELLRDELKVLQRNR